MGFLFQKELKNEFPFSENAQKWVSFPKRAQKVANLLFWVLFNISIENSKNLKPIFNKMVYSIDKK